MTPADPKASTTAPDAQASSERPLDGHVTPPPSNVDWSLTDRMRAAVERLEGLADEIVAKLDELNADPDLEPDEDLEKIGDEEPSLGSLNNHHKQEHWGLSADLDREEEHDGREPDHDAEEVCEDEGAACEDEGFDCDREPDTDAEGDAQAPCHWFPDHPSPWPPRPSVDEALARLGYPIAVDPRLGK